MLSVAVVIALTTSCVAAEDLCTPREDWDRAFQRSDGWTGGDADYAVDLGDGRTLWLFADSWIGAVKEGRHAAGSRLVNNALAVHATPRDGAAPEQVEFSWGAADDEGRPTAFFRPDRARVAARPSSQGDPDAPSWYWVADAVLVGGGDGRPRLVEFLWHVGRTKGTGVWTFESVGGAVAVIDNPGERPDRWSITQHDNPWVVTEADKEKDPAARPVTWGSALVVEGDWLYVYGTRAGGLNTQLILARAPSGEVTRFEAWRFRTADGWSERPGDAVGLADGMTSEFSVDWVSIGGRQKYVLVQSEPWFGTRILARTSDALDGPWSGPVPIYQVPGVDQKRKYFTYAAKGHSHLSAPGRLLVSYIINSHDFGAMVGDASIYRPRFVELDLERLRGQR